MTVEQAREIARQWVMAEGQNTPGFQGAFLHGSLNYLPTDEPLPHDSDVDIMVVLSEPDPPIKPGKLLYEDVLLEVSYLSIEQVQSPEQVLSNYHLAGSFRSPHLLLDPSGHLTNLQATVSRDFAEPHWVRKRCEHARNHSLKALQSLDENAPFHDQVTAWLFGTGITTHILLVAGLRNPTVRRRYIAVRELLADYGQADFYPLLLGLVGATHLTPTQVTEHLSRLTEAFDATKTVIRSPFFFASDLSDAARPIAIDGSWEMIESGDHREAIFWMVATYSRCQKVLFQDAPPEMCDAFTPGYRALLSDLGITTFADMQQRANEVQAFLLRIDAVAEAILLTEQETP